MDRQFSLLDAKQQIFLNFAGKTRLVDIACDNDFFW